MSYFPLGMYKSNAVLSDYLRKNIRLENITARRNAVPIAAIDDEPFSPQTSLTSFGYNITQLGDIKRVSEIEKYPIVLCDLMGVGVHFDKTSQGATIIQEIKKNYPAIIIVAYTGASLGSVQARAAKDLSDAVIKKDDDNQEWISTLDSLIDRAIDPHSVWKRIRQSLVTSDIDTKDLLILEDAYVRSVLAKDGSFKILRGVLGSLNLKGDVRSIVQSIIGSAIYALIFGG